MLELLLEELGNDFMFGIELSKRLNVSVVKNKSFYEKKKKKKHGERRGSVIGLEVKNTSVN